MTLKEGWLKLPIRLRSFLTAIDIVLGGGRTVSENLARSRDRGEWIGAQGCKVLDGLDPGHCDRARDYPPRITNV